jgi:hypothetical protein
MINTKSGATADFSIAPVLKGAVWAVTGTVSGPPDAVEVGQFAS